MADLRLEKSLGWNSLLPICGVDEVGRGPLAGPVVAAACVLLPEKLSPALAATITDSKKLTARQRETVFPEILRCSHWALGEASVAEIDQLNILNASLLAMQRAVRALPITPVHALIDGNRCPKDLPCLAQAIVGGDGTSLSIAAASIIAKVHRDRLMRTLAEQYPGYGWEKNAGYGTSAHMLGIKMLGVTPHHRLSFAPVKAAM